MQEDQHLLKCLRCGDQDALRRIYEKYRYDMFSVAASLLHDLQTSEDCVQDVFVAFAGASGNSNIHRNLKGYLVSCVANRARNLLKQKPARMNRPLDETSLISTAKNPPWVLIENEQSAQLFAALAQLPYQQREVFVLHVQGEMKFRQIARLQNVSIKTVLSRYRYGIDKLQTLLSKESKHEIQK